MTQFRFESGARSAPAEGTVDAAVVFFKDAWHLFSHNQQANTGRGYHAVSIDGLAFTQAADVVVPSSRQWIGNALVHEGLLRYYGSGMGGVWSATSSDGAAWSHDPGTRVSAAGDAAAVVLASGETLLVAVGGLRADAGPSPFGPWDHWRKPTPSRRGSGVGE